MGSLSPSSTCISPNNWSGEVSCQVTIMTTFHWVISMCEVEAELEQRCPHSADPWKNHKTKETSVVWKESRKIMIPLQCAAVWVRATIKGGLWSYWITIFNEGSWIGWSFVVIILILITTLSLTPWVLYVIISAPHCNTLLLSICPFVYLMYPFYSSSDMVRSPPLFKLFLSL